MQITCDLSVCFLNLSNFLEDLVLFLPIVGLGNCVCQSSQAEQYVNNYIHCGVSYSTIKRQLLYTDNVFSAVSSQYTKYIICQIP